MQHQNGQNAPFLLKSCPNSAQTGFRAGHWTFASRSTPPSGFSDIAFVADVVSLEDLTGFVSADFHRNASRNTELAEIPNAGPAKIMEDKVELLLWRKVCVDKTMNLNQAKTLYLKRWTRLLPQK